MLKSFVAQKPDDAFARYALAHEFKNTGDLASAWESFAVLLRDHGGYVPGYLHAGNTLVALGRVDEARSVYAQGIEAAQRVGDGHARSELEGALAGLAV